MNRTDTPISDLLDVVDEPGGALLSLVTRLRGGGVRVVPKGRRSVSIVVQDGTVSSPTVDGIFVPKGSMIGLTSDFPGNNLPQINVVSHAGDDVLVLETWLEGSEPVHAPSRLLTDGAHWLLEDGGRWLLEG